MNMTNFVIKGNEAIISMVDDIDFKSIKLLTSLIDQAVDYYFVDQVLIEINSHGGELSALEFYLSRLKKWRDKGVVIKTHALATVASAAAVLLSMGDIGYRTSEANARILYHNSRVNGDLTLTAIKAKQLNEHLANTDEMIVDRLFEHNKPVIEELLSKHGVFPLESISSINGQWKKTRYKSVNNGVRLVGQKYRNLFEWDEFLKPEQVVNLGLIDQVI